MKIFNQIKFKFIFIATAVLVILCSMSEYSYAERYFKKHSTWYEPIPNPAPLHQNSDNIIKYYQNGADNYDSPEWKLSRSSKSHQSVYFADKNTATVTVKYWSDGQQWYEDNWNDVIVPRGWNKVPIPTHAITSNNNYICTNNWKGKDSRLVIVNYERTKAWDFNMANKCNGVWAARIIKQWDLTGDGVVDKWEYPRDGATTHLARTPWMHGTLLRRELKDVTAPVIDHALVITVPCTIQGQGVYPSYGQGIKGHASCSKTDGLDYGARVQLDPSLDPDIDFGFVPDKYEKAIIVALQTYGAIAVDGGPGTEFILEDLNNKSETWPFPNNINQKLQWKHFRVIVPLKPPFDTSVQTYSSPADYTETSTDNTKSNDSSYSYIINVDPLVGTYIDAENSTGTINLSGISSFLPNNDLTDYAGKGYLTTSGSPASDCSHATEGKEYKVNFEDTGIYNIWIRGYGFDSSSDSLYIGVDGKCIGVLNTNYIHNQWVWTNNLQLNSGVNTLDITSPGIHTINIWIREPNFYVDGIYLTMGTEDPPEDIAFLDSIPPAPPMALFVE